MPIEVLRDVDVLADGFRLRGIMNSVALSEAADLVEANTFGDTGKRRLAGLRSPTVDMEGLFDATLDAELQSRIGLADVPITVAPNDSVDGARAFFFRAIAGEYSYFGALGDANPFSFSAEGSDGGVIVRGTIGHAGIETVTGVGVGRQLGAVAAGQSLFAVLHVLAASVADTLDVIVESDDNAGFTTPTTRGTFTQQSAIGSAVLVPVAGPITDDWWRVSWTLGGAAPSFDFINVIGFA